MIIDHKNYAGMEIRFKESEETKHLRKSNNLTSRRKIVRFNADKILREMINLAEDKYLQADVFSKETVKRSGKVVIKTDSHIIQKSVKKLERLIELTALMIYRQVELSGEKPTAFFVNFIDSIWSLLFSWVDYSHRQLYLYIKDCNKGTHKRYNSSVYIFLDAIS